MVLSSQALSAKPGCRVALAFPAGLVMVSEVKKAAARSQADLPLLGECRRSRHGARQKH